MPKALLKTALWLACLTPFAILAYRAAILSLLAMLLAGAWVLRRVPER